MISKLRLLLPLLAFTFFTLNGCNNDNTTEKVINVGFVPSENMQEVTKNAQPLAEMLSKAVGKEVKTFIATDYTGIVEAFRAGKLDIAFLTPAAYVMANNEAGVKVVLKAQRHGNDFFYSAIITRKDSGINKLEDFKDKTFSFGDTLSTSGNIFPKKMFLDKGIDPKEAFKHVIYSGGHDATVLAVFNKKVDGGAVFSNDTKGHDGAWTQFLKPEEASQIKAIAYSDPIPADNVCVSKDLDPEIEKKLTQAFIDVGKDKVGQKLIQKLYRIDSFVPATDKDYESVKIAIKVAGIDLPNELANKKKK
ncbi:MAG: phosphate/phosphite/phosphonate ABC transporter substrate-binding protein [Candidatus Sericytochromatia bacterium]|nr:phosphate/phosphite/phosphonate ABC transporter substrate-binding protein [Candidatus Sericytochromatia bacterium]